MAIPTDTDCFYPLTVSCGSETNALRGKLAVRALNTTSKSPEIINVVEGAGGGIPDITIRGNTLEDVFSYVIGRALKE
ncbi:MAG: hypothetical protein ACXV5N_10155 [Halobacteriota archaeon]